MWGGGGGGGSFTSKDQSLYLAFIMCAIIMFKVKVCTGLLYIRTQFPIFTKQSSEHFTSLPELTEVAAHCRYVRIP